MHPMVPSLAPGSSKSTKHPMVLSMGPEILHSVDFETSSRIRFFKCETGPLGTKIGKKNGSKFVGENRPKSNDFGWSNPVCGTNPFLGLSVCLCGPLDPALKPHCLSRFPLPRTITCGVMLDRGPYAPRGLYFSRANDVSMRLVS